MTCHHLIAPLTCVLGVYRICQKQMTGLQVKSHSASDLEGTPAILVADSCSHLAPVDPHLLRLRLSEDLHSHSYTSPGTPTPIPTPVRSANASPVTPDPVEPSPEQLFSEHILSQCLDIDTIHPKKVRTHHRENEDPPDPRIQSELERMNRSCDDINNLESQLTRNQNEEKRILREGNKRLKDIKLQISDKTVNTARYYYETLQAKKELQMRLNRSAIEYEKSKLRKDESRARVVETELEYLKLRESLASQQCDDNGMDANCRHQHSEAIENINSANGLLDVRNLELTHKQSCHKEQLLEFNTIHLRLEEYRRKNNKSILSALPYFQAKSHYEEKQHDLLATRNFIQDQVKEAKIRYSVALKNLEAISQQIHHLRDNNNYCSFKIELLREPFYLLDGESGEGGYQRELAHSRQSLRSLHSFNDIHEIDRYHFDLSPDKSSSMQCLKELKESDVSLKLL